MKTRQLKARAIKNGMRENFGQKELRLLEEFIGPVYDYSYDDRLVNIGIIRDFDDWAMNYTGK